MQFIRISTNRKCNDAEEGDARSICLVDTGNDQRTCTSNRDAVMLVLLIHIYRLTITINSCSRSKCMGDGWAHSNIMV